MKPFKEKNLQEQEAEARQFKYYWFYLLLQEEKRLNISHILSYVLLSAKLVPLKY